MVFIRRNSLEELSLRPDSFCDHKIEETKLWCLRLLGSFEHLYLMSFLKATERVIMGKMQLSTELLRKPSMFKYDQIYSGTSLIGNS